MHNTRDLGGLPASGAHILPRRLLRSGMLGPATTEDARVLLPECVATKIAMCCNLREFRHILSLRLDKAAWTPIRELVGMMKEEFLQYYPSVLLDGVVKE